MMHSPFNFPFDAKLYSILLVDDESHILKSLTRLLLPLGFNVTSFIRPEDALEFLKSEYVHLILSDFRMPGLNGAEFLLQASRYNADAVGMILSGYTDYDMLVDTINSGVAFRFLQKPWSNEEVLTAITAGLQQYQAKLYLQKKYQLLLNDSELILELNREAKITASNLHDCDDTTSAALVFYLKEDIVPLLHNPTVQHVVAQLPTFGEIQLHTLLTSAQNTMIGIQISGLYGHWPVKQQWRLIHDLLLPDKESNHFMLANLYIQAMPLSLDNRTALVTALHPMLEREQLRIIFTHNALLLAIAADKLSHQDKLLIRLETEIEERIYDALDLNVSVKLDMFDD
ncbi:response regulator [Pseudoalteromonas fenneropenaei]|uniref:Response regulator n=1 Tax=Pseudoalteromonas fenneropenaei TaxID=1737459 RepID=A0ABV7CFI1_9GAMM